MSVQLLDEIRRCSKAPPAARAVLMMIAFHHHHEDPTRTVELDAEQLADEAGCRRSQLYEHLKTLYGLGELTKLEGGGGRGKATRWRIPALEERATAGRWRTPGRPNARPLIATAKPSGNPDANEAEIPSDIPDALSPGNRPVNGPGSRTDPSRVNAVGVEGEKKNPPPTPPSKLGGELPLPGVGKRGMRVLGTNPRARGTNPRALAAGVRSAQAEDAAAAAVAAMRPPDQADEHDWTAFRALLRRSVSDSSWHVHLEPVTLAAIDTAGGFVLVAPPGSWAPSRYQRLFAESAERVGRSTARIATAEEAAALARAA